MKRLYSIDEFAKLPEQQRDAESSIATTSLGAPEFGESGRIVRYTFSTPAVGRDLHTVAPDAWQLANFSKNPVFLWFHDDSQPPIGRVIDIGDERGALKGSVEYAQADLNPFADMIYRMVKARYINAVSTSWQPLAWEFSRDKSRPGGVDFTKVDLLEISQVPIPALPNAIATARASGINTGPLFSWAERLLDTGGICAVPRDELENLRRAAKMPKRTSESATDTPDEADDKKERALKAKHARALARAPKVPVFKRGLYEVAQLCYMLEQFGYCHNASEYEAAIEGDKSEVPAMLGEALVKFGEALKAMADEEIEELLEAHEGGEEDAEAEIQTRSLSAADRESIAAAPTARCRAWRSGVAVARAGKALSASNQEKLGEAQGHHERALKHHREMGEHHAALGTHMDSVQEHHERATQTLDELGDHLRAAHANPAESADHLERAAKSQGETEKHMGAAAEAHQSADDSHEDVGDSHNAVGRRIKGAQRCVRAVLSGAVTSEADESDADAVKGKEAAKAEKARAARAARARDLAKAQPRDPTTLD